jgi:hypothetical protein
MTIVAAIKKHLNPLSSLFIVFVLISTSLIIFPGPEGWGILGGIALFILFGFPTIVINIFIVWFIPFGKKRLITQFIFALIIVLIFAWIWAT